MHEHVLTHTNSKSNHSLSVSIAKTKSEIKAAQALRYRVFAEEMGAKLSTKEPGLDQDLFDKYCDHLIAQDNLTGEVIGTYRILPPHKARKVGSYYSDTEFDLTRLQHIRSQLVELGRTCVHPDYRTGSTIALLWSGLTQYMVKNNYQYMMGCASVSLNDGGHTAASLYRKIAKKAMAPVEWRVFPRCPLPISALDEKIEIETPALIKGYLRAGALVCGEPAWDPDFNTADFLMLLPTQNINNRYAKHFAR
ncbi:GNAT family N-acetyltransferase [Chitinibacter bivalviorum]|uniref:L-ornithine N(alpha)-acyltransferase n=1 Tax=Chitinibacter bivalviorum TaxID=2739434 RepID=A0A7H9BJY5_9NEIS|nr:GNAT family N-acyltransferase [Chitinibacter bivalviorum]QLG88682.1 GNAT family N-acetyltransferase [Chitinibacter bivalviorum]